MPADLTVDPTEGTSGEQPELVRFVDVMRRLREECPWDARQTHRSLVQYLIEETGETVEAIESGDAEHLREELGDLLLQVVFHATIAAENDDFTLADVARGVADKLITRHPHVFADAEAPVDADATWEQRKAIEKGRTSALEGIPEQLSALARAQKVISRTRSRQVPVDLDTTPVTADQVGSEVLTLVQRAQAAGIDAEQAVRDALRGLEADIRTAEPTP